MIIEGKVGDGSVQKGVKRAIKDQKRKGKVERGRSETGREGRRRKRKRLEERSHRQRLISGGKRDKREGLRRVWERRGPSFLLVG